MSLIDIERQELEAERARLVTRIGEIDAALRRTTVAEPPAGDSVWVLLSSTGLIGTWNSAGPVPNSGPRTTHDVITAAVRTTGTFGAITNWGRIVKAEADTLPQLAVTENAPNLQGAKLAADVLALKYEERVVGLTTLTSTTFGWVLGTRKGVVKRTNPEIPRGVDSWEIIRLEDDDEVIGAVELPHEQRQLIFITSDAQLLHYPAVTVRPQGRQGGGMAGIKLNPDQRVIFFGTASLQNTVVVTNAGRKSARDSDAAGSLKVTPFDAFPEKGRATGGVRCHRFLKGEDVLYLGWVGQIPAIAATKSGSPSNLPAIEPRRDGSGTNAAQRVTAFGSRQIG